MKVIATFFSLFILLSFNLMLFGQEAKKTQMHIKVEKDVNGEKTSIDTVITADNAADLHQMLQDMGLESHIEMSDGNHTWIHEEEGEHPKDIQVKVIKMDSKDGELPELEGLDDETRALLEKHMQEGKEGGKMIFIHKNGDSTLQQLEGSGDHKVIMFKQEGEGDEGEHTMMFMGEPGEGGEQQMRVTIEMDEEQTEDGKVVIEKKVRVAIFLKDVEEGDTEVLKRSGVEVNNLENSLSIEQLSFYPNPNNGRFNLSFESPEKGDVNITVVNAEGRKVYEEKLPGFSGAYEKQIDLSGNPSGVYFLNLAQNGKVLNKKLVVK